MISDIFTSEKATNKVWKYDSMKSMCMPIDKTAGVKSWLSSHLMSICFLGDCTPFPSQTVVSWDQKTPTSQPTIHNQGRSNVKEFYKFLWVVSCVSESLWANDGKRAETGASSITVPYQTPQNFVVCLISMYLHKSCDFWRYYRTDGVWFDVE